MPPALDDALTKNMLQLLSYSPILLIFNGLWMISNRQIFDSWVNSISTTTDLMETGHTLKSMINRVQPSSPLLMICFVFLVIILIRNYFYSTLRKWGFTITKTEIVVDEDLPNFYEAVKLGDADWMVYENKNLRENYGFDML